MRQMIIAAMVAFAGLTGPALAEDTPPAKAPTAAAAPAAPPVSPGRRKYQSIFPVNTPKAVLDPLKAEEGVWTADVELYVGDPAKQPIRKTGVQTNRLVSKGNAIINEFAYDDGSYAGTGMWGWDAYTNRYTGTWIDSDTHLVRHDIGYYDLTLGSSGGRPTPCSRTASPRACASARNSKATCACSRST